MSKNFALIQNKVIENIIIADDNFLPLITEQYESIECIDGLDPKPHIGWIKTNSGFEDPNILKQEEEAAKAAIIQKRVDDLNKVKASIILKTWDLMTAPEKKVAINLEITDEELNLLVSQLAPS